MGLAGVPINEVWRKQDPLLLAKIVSLVSFFFVCLYSSLTSVGKVPKPTIGTLRTWLGNPRDHAHDY